jgi:hypothetical protein
MTHQIGQALIVELGEDEARDLSDKFPNATIPGKKFWVRRANAQFREDYRCHRVDQETPEVLARRYGVCLRTIFAWRRDAIRDAKVQATKQPIQTKGQVK